MIDDHLVLIVDLNELENGNELPVSMDYTANAGPGVSYSRLQQPAVGQWVYVHSDDDDTLYYAQVISVESERDLTVRIDWNTCVPVLNPEWSAQDISDHWSFTTAPSTLGVTA